MNPAFQSFLESSQRRCQSALDTFLDGSISEFEDTDSALDTFQAATQYSLSNGGKRIRPLLLYCAANAISPNTSAEALDHAACAIEMLHTYSLVHDDLPAMDDDDLRRGQASLHKAYDDATAILVGDGLQAKAFELLATAPNLSDSQRLTMVKTLAAAAGPRGMVGGQAIDIGAVGQQMNLGQLRAMHALKTGAIIRAALALGGIAANASKAQLTQLDVYGCHIGLAFQVVDDILDVESDTATLGKTQGKDSEADKPTYVSLLGLERAKDKAQGLLNDALAALKNFDNNADYLRDLASYIIERKA